jgi:hypothetical protein
VRAGYAKKGSVKLLPVLEFRRNRHTSAHKTDGTEPAVWGKVADMALKSCIYAGSAGESKALRTSFAHSVTLTVNLWCAQSPIPCLR